MRKWIPEGVGGKERKVKKKSLLLKSSQSHRGNWVEGPANSPRTAQQVLGSRGAEEGEPGLKSKLHVKWALESRGWREREEKLGHS